MGTSSTPKELANKLARLAEGLSDERAGLTAGAQAAKRSLEAARNAAGVSPKNARMFYKNERERVVIGSRFPGWVINNPTRGHIIGARKLGTKAGFRKRQAGIGALAAFGGTNKFKPRNVKRGSKALGGGLAALAGGPRPYAFHPGTRGLGFWQKGAQAAQETAPKAFKQAQLTKPMREIFK